MPFLLIIYILLLVFCLISRKNTGKIFYITIIFLWFIATFCQDNADTMVYQTRYDSYLLYMNSTEVGFNLLMAFFHMLRMDFSTFLGVAYAFILGIFGWFFKKNSSHSSWLLALYAIFPFCMDAVQLRNTLAFTVVLIGIDSLMRECEFISVNISDLL